MAVQSELTFVEPIIGRPLGDDEAAGITLCFCAAIERWKVVRRLSKSSGGLFGW